LFGWPTDELQAPPKPLFPTTPDELAPNRVRLQLQVSEPRAKRPGLPIELAGRAVVQLGAGAAFCRALGRDDARVHGQAPNCGEIWVRVGAYKGASPPPPSVLCGCRRMASLSLYRDVEKSDGEITDDRMTLKDCGIEGAPASQEPVSLDGPSCSTSDLRCVQPIELMYFDYRPYSFDEPVLLAEHRSSPASSPSKPAVASASASPVGAASPSATT
jgi:hypothetical protein